MKFGNSVKSCWKSCASYAKKHYIMTFVMILVIVLIIIYFNKNHVFENYVSQYADAKNRNVTVLFTGTSKILGQGCCIYKVGYNSELKTNYFGSDGNEQYGLTTTSQNISGKSGDYGWVIGIVGSVNGNGTYNYNSTFTFDMKNVVFDNAFESILPKNNIIVNNSNKQYVTIKYDKIQTLVNPIIRKSMITINASNVPYDQIYISLKFI